ncbi:hypothetical protein Droror1_Dr00015764 [Drosera rotundifolia]
MKPTKSNAIDTINLHLTPRLHQSKLNSGPKLLQIQTKPRSPFSATREGKGTRIRTTVEEFSRGFGAERAQGEGERSVAWELMRSEICGGKSRTSFERPPDLSSAMGEARRNI